MRTQEEKPPLTKEQLKEMDHASIIAYDPDNYSMDRNGTIHDKRLYNRIVKGQEKPNFTDPQKATEAINKRHNDAREAALKGLASIAPAQQPAAAWEIIAKARAQAAADPDNAQGNAATRLIGEMTGLMRKESEADARPGITINIDAEAAHRLLEAIARNKRKDQEQTAT